MIEAALGYFRARYGWVMVFVAGSLMGMGFGAQVSVSVFLKPLGAELGWARGDISFAYSLAAFFSGASGVLMGYWADRYGARRFVLGGSLMMGVAYVLLSFVTQRWELYVLYGLLVGGLCQGAFLAPMLTNVGFWFDKDKGLALGLALAGQSLGAALVPLAARLLISSLGWRQAYQALGIGAWAILVPLALLVREPPALARSRAAVRARGYVPAAASAPSRGGGRPGVVTAALCGAIVCCCICMSIPIIHVVALATDRGVEAQTAAGILTVLMVVSVIGRVGIGRVADWIGGIRALLLASATQTAMIFWFTQASSPLGYYVIAVAFAIGYGGVIPAYAVILREVLPPGRVGASMGLVMFFGNLGMATGGFLGGALFDWSGSYLLPFATGAAAGVVNLAVVAALLLYVRGQHPAPAAAQAA
jgi:MFS family permease